MRSRFRRACYTYDVKKSVAKGEYGMRLFLHGDPTDCRHFKALCEKHGRFDYTENHQEHLIAETMLPHDHAAAVVICDGAAGMEAAMVIRRLYPALPLIWFSDDSAFGVQAHRLQAAYFAEKSHLAERVSTALERAGLLMG